MTNRLITKQFSGCTKAPRVDGDDDPRPTQANTASRRSAMAAPAGIPGNRPKLSAPESTIGRFHPTRHRHTLAELQQRAELARRPLETHRAPASVSTEAAGTDSQPRPPLQTSGRLPTTPPQPGTQPPRSGATPEVAATSPEQAGTDAGHAQKSRGPMKFLRKTGTAIKHVTAALVLGPGHSRNSSKPIPSRETPMPQPNAALAAPRQGQVTRPLPSSSGQSTASARAERNPSLGALIGMRPSPSTTPALTTGDAGADVARPKSHSAAQKVGRTLKHFAADWFVPARSYPFNQNQSPSREALPQRPAVSEAPSHQDHTRPLPPPVRHAIQRPEPSQGRSPSIESRSSRHRFAEDAAFVASPRYSPAHERGAFETQAAGIGSGIEPAAARVVTESPADNGELPNSAGANDRLTWQPSQRERLVEPQVVPVPEPSLSRSPSIASLSSQYESDEGALFAISPLDSPAHDSSSAEGESPAGNRELPYPTVANDRLTWQPSQRERLVEPQVVPVPEPSLSRSPSIASLSSQYESDEGALFAISPLDSPAHDSFSAEGESPAGNRELPDPAVANDRLTWQPSQRERLIEPQAIQIPQPSTESPSDYISVPRGTILSMPHTATSGPHVLTRIPAEEEEVSAEDSSDDEAAFFTPPLQVSPAHDTVVSEPLVDASSVPSTSVPNWQEEGPFQELPLEAVPPPAYSVIEITEEETLGLHPQAETSAVGAGSGSPPGTPGGSFRSDGVRQPPDADAGTDIAQIHAGENPLRSPRRDKTNRQDYVVGWKNHTRAGAATTLHRFAKVSTELATAGGKPPVAPTHTPGLISRAFNAVKRRVGLPGNVDWMKSTIRDVRAKACRSHPEKPSVTPTQALWLLGQEQPVSLFWKQPALARHANFGRHRNEVLGHLDTLALASSPRISLALSFACLSATEGSPSKLNRLNMDLFHTLADPNLIDRLIAPPGAEPAGTAPTLELARDVLHQCTRSNRFDALVKTLSPSIQDHQLPILRRYLQADEAVRNTPARGASAQFHDEDIAAMEEGRGPNTPTLAMRVRDSARSQLASAGNPVNLTSRQTADAFFWDNNFREEGHGTALHELKQHFFEAIEQLSKNADAKGPLNSAYKYGLAGADRKLFSDEEEKLIKLRDDPELDGLVQDMQGSLVKLLNAENASLAGPNAMPSDNAIRVLACLIALEAWSPEHRAQLSLTDIVQGRAHELGDIDSEARLVASACARFIGRQRFERADDMQEPASTLMQQFTLSQMISSGDLMTRVRSELKNVRLGFPALEVLARECGVEVSAAAWDVLERARQTINAETEYPKESTPEAASEMMQKFLSAVYFGNHIKLSSVAAGGFTGRGTAVNLSTYLAYPPQDGASILAKVPVLARGDLRVEGSQEHVIRAGAATHGGEFFLGTDVKRRLAAGGGLHTGYVVPLGDGGSQGRVSGGLDALPYGYDQSDYEGMMLRVDRVVREDVGDPHEPRFVQNEAEVRETMSGLARTLFERAKDARDEVSREQILEDIISEFGPHGLSITLMKQQSSTHRSEASLGMGVSATTGAWAGGRFGLGGGGTIEKGWRTSVTEMDTTGSYRINNLRTGWFDRKRFSTDVGGNVYTGSAGIPPTTLAGATWSQGESGGSVRVRTPLREGNIVPEKAFSDTETPDKNLFKEYVLSNRQKWDDLFAYEFRDLGPEEARRKGRDRTDAFLYKMESLREENHVYYARERIHPDVADRINDWAGVEALVPPAMESFRAELAAAQQRLASDDRSWGAASLIAYQKNVLQDGWGNSVGGIKASNVAAVEGEREIIFDTIGWANLRQRERDNLPTHLDD